MFFMTVTREVAVAITAARQLGPEPSGETVLTRGPDWAHSSGN
jgi:hypothetical protein